MRKFWQFTILGAAVFLSACATGPVAPDSINDPFEDVNRSVHEFNKLADKTVLRPVALTYGAVVPEPVQRMVDNSVNNLAVPGQTVNLVLQGNLEDAFRMTVRFVINSTIGIGGLFDPASDAGLFQKKTDFGETLGVWGVAEGPYLELPLLGGSTVRDTVGMVVDYAIDPMQYVLSEQDRKRILLLKGMDLVGDRFAYSDLVDALLYESADSYAAQRISYLQNARRNLQGETAVEDLEDPYAFE